MNEQEFYSVRMRATAGGRHISGAERIVTAEQVDAVVEQIPARAMNRSVLPDRIDVSVESICARSIRRVTGLDVVTVDVPDAPSGRSAAARVLEEAGVSRAAIDAAIRAISRGASPTGGNMRGAMIVDAGSGERLEPDPERGVRASRFDWSPEAARRISGILQGAGLTHFRTREALALASKVAHAPGIVAELCWSDEPGYLAGYAAAPNSGYVRFSVMKRQGDPFGGRAFFVNKDNVDIGELVRYLESEPVLVADTGSCRHSQVFSPGPGKRGIRSGAVDRAHDAE